MANSKIKLVLSESSQYSEREKRIRHQYPKGWRAVSDIAIRSRTRVLQWGESFFMNDPFRSARATPSSRKAESMDPAFTELCHCIREKCRRDGWYGGTLDLRHASPGHPQRHGFAYPPASEEQLRATEAALGFTLPPVLRALYAEVANGGFGPGAGIQGALGGYGSRADEPARTIVDDYHWHCQVGYTEGGHHGPVQAQGNLGAGEALRPLHLRRNVDRVVERGVE